MDRPNVLFVMSDQHRWDFMGYETNGVTYTPNLDRVGKSGTVFHAAYCPAPLCSPARAAIASGRHCSSTGCYTNLHELPPGTPSFVTQLRRSGYRTCAVGKTHMEIHAYDSDLTSDRHRAFMDSLGWDEICEVSGNGMFRTGIRCSYSEHLRERGVFDDVIGFYDHWGYFLDKKKGAPDFSCKEWPFGEDLQETAFIGSSAVEWLEKRDRSVPFFLHVGFAAPHSPIEPLPSFMDRYRDTPEPPPKGEGPFPDWIPEGRRGYRAMISQVDHWVGRICDVLASQGVLEDTIVVYTADHGEMAGDQGMAGKTNFFEGSARVPLLMAGPGVRAGEQSTALVETLDIGRTICELSSVEPHALDQGRSLVPVLSGAQGTHRETVFSEMGCDKMIRDERYKLMWGDPRSDTRRLGRLHLDKPVNIAPSPPRLYDLKEDPDELDDLAQDDSKRDLLRIMMEKLLVRVNENVQAQPLKDRGEYRPLRAR